MGILEFASAQLRKPSGFIGRVLISRILNRGNAPLNQLTLNSLNLSPDDRVLEIGFGGGDLINRMSTIVTRGQIAGADFSLDMVELCKKRFAKLVQQGGLELHCSSAESLPFESTLFTRVCTVNTIYFWPDPIGPMKEMHRVMRDGGRLVITFNPPETLRKVPYTRTGFNHYEPGDVQRMLEQSGFRDIQMIRGTSRLGDFVCAIATKQSTL
jgi:SAM-dependent methyltransferase